MKSRRKDCIKDLSFKAQKSKTNGYDARNKCNLSTPSIGIPSIGTPNANFQHRVANPPKQQQ